jgi:hypothetical protein
MVRLADGGDKRMALLDGLIALANHLLRNAISMLHVTYLKIAIKIRSVSAITVCRFHVPVVQKSGQAQEKASRTKSGT